jgi:hypothetical protein
VQAVTAELLALFSIANEDFANRLFWHGPREHAHCFCAAG